MIPPSEPATLEILGRPTHEYFVRDVLERKERLLDAIRGRRFLVVGGAGSIGSATLEELLRFGPSAVHVVDQDENRLAELVRTLRSRPAGLDVPDFRVLPLDYGSPLMARFLHRGRPYDAVLSFAAVKHVRSEKDVPSILHLLDCNVVKTARLLGWLADSNTSGRFFSVSTDKAAHPVSLMGASKRIMEGLVFGIAPGIGTSARFANVAFSNGSLLESFVSRLSKGQPLAVPAATRRYFVTLAESGRICLLAALAIPDSHLLIPGAAFRDTQHDLQTLAERFLRSRGLEPVVYTSEKEARRAAEARRDRDDYPLLVTSRDTSGEKASEEFFGPGEAVVDLEFNDLQAIVPALLDPRAVNSFVTEIERLVSAPGLEVTKEELVALVHQAVPGLHHMETGKTLDDRM